VQGLPGIRWPRLRGPDPRALRSPDPCAPRPLRSARVLLVALLCTLSLTAIACGDDDDSDGSNGSGNDAPAAQTPEEQPPENEPQPTETEQQAEAGCQEVAAPQPRQDGGAKRPSGGLEPQATYVVTLDTSCGAIGIRLDQKTSPKTTASFAHLARTGFYDGTVFHRIVPGFVIQGGDPTGSGTGGPGYTTRDVPPQNASYVRGVVAMAKSGAEPPGTGGSQFFIVTGPDAGLPPDYALVGEVVRGQRVVDEIGQLGDPASGGAGTPLQPVVIEGARVSER
jgi:peptidyl-prolyl cis-trans isomerase B (cyclophilin B)